MNRDEKFQAADELFGLRKVDIENIVSSLLAFGDEPMEIRKLPRNERRNYFAYVAWLAWLKDQENPEVTE